jgi:hypothetical protein
MKIKNVIEGTGFLTMMISASCDMEYSDPNAVLVITLIGCILLWYGGKDYEPEDDTH